MLEVLRLMTLIIRKLKYKKDYSDVRMIDTNKDNFKQITDFNYKGVNYRLAEYEKYSNPVKSRRLTYVTKFKGSVEDLPFKLFDYNDGEKVVNEKKLSARLANAYGPGQYNVFKFGGNPPKEDYFKNRFIEKLGKAEEA